MEKYYIVQLIVQNQPSLGAQVVHPVHGHAGARPYSVGLALSHAALEDLNVPVMDVNNEHSNSYY